jgi:hypothetical protein
LACFDPTDPFAYEVVLSKPGVSYDLGKLKLADNVLIEEGVIVYRSHFDSRVAVILKSVNEVDVGLMGLSVRIQIPTQEVAGEIVQYGHTTIDQSTSIDLMDIDENLVRSLGYEYTRLDKEATVLMFSKEDVTLTIAQGDDVDIRARFVGRDSINDSIVEELKGLVVSLGTKPEAMDDVMARLVTEEIDITIEPVAVNEDEFDFAAAMKTELDWLKLISIVRGIDDSDATMIVSLAKSGLAGWNSRIVYDERWVSYSETGKLMFRDNGPCDGFMLDRERVPQADVLLPVAAVSSKGKLVTKWGCMKDYR